MRRSHRKRSRTAPSRKGSPPTQRRGAGTRRRAPADGHPDPFLATFQRLIGEIFRFNGALLDVAAELARDLGVNPTHWQTVATVRVAPLTVSEISRRVGLRRQSVQHTVSQLMARGLLELVENPRHQRARLVRLTAAGQALMKDLHERQVALTQRFTHGLGLSVADLEALIGLLHRMQEAGELAGESPDGSTDRDREE